MAEKEFLVDIELNKNQVKNAVEHLLDSAPEDPVKGQRYFNTTDNKSYIWDGTKWQSGKEYVAGGGLTLTGDTLAVENPISSSEKQWLDSQLFTGSISANPSSHVFSGVSQNVVFTLTTKYDGTNADCDSVPSGWTRVEVGTYTKTAEITSQTGSLLSSGPATCVYHGNSKTFESAACSNIKYSYLFESQEERIPSDEGSLDPFITESTRILSTSNSITGYHTYTTRTEGYLYFAMAETSTLKNIYCCDASILRSRAGVWCHRTDYGLYRVYRTAIKLSAGALIGFTIE